MKTIEKIRTKCSEIWLDEEGILRIKSFEGSELDLEETMACFEIYRQLGCDKKKVLQLMDVWDNASMTNEAKEYAAKNGKDFFIASAVISSSLVVRMLVNFYNSFYKHQVPFKMFATEAEALKWLKGFR